MKKGELKNFILFLSGKGVSLFGSDIYRFAMGLYVLKLTGSGMSFAITIFISLIPQLFIGPISGVVADRVNRKKMVVVCDLLSGIVMILAFLATMYWSLNLTIIYISAFGLSLMSTLFNTAFEASMPSLVSDENFNKIQSYNQTVTSGANILSPMLGGLMFALVSPIVFILINGASFIISGISEMFINYKFNDKESMTLTNQNIELKNVINDLKEGYKAFTGNLYIKVLYKYILFINFFFSAISLVIPYIVVTELKVSDSGYGIIAAGFSIGTFIFSLILARRKTDDISFASYGYKMLTLPFIIILMALPVLPYTITLLTSNAVIYYSLIYVALGGIILYINVPMQVLIIKETKVEFRGRIVAFASTISRIILPIGYLVHGLALDFVPSYAIVIYCSISSLVVVLLMIRDIHKTENRKGDLIEEIAN